MELSQLLLGWFNFGKLFGDGVTESWGVWGRVRVGWEENVGVERWGWGVIENWSRG